MISPLSASEIERVVLRQLAPARECPFTLLVRKGKPPNHESTMYECRLGVDHEGWCRCGDVVWRRP